MKFGNMLTSIRRSKGISQRALAKSVGMSFSEYSVLENDRTRQIPNPELINRIIDAVGCTEEEKTNLLEAAKGIKIFIGDSVSNMKNTFYSSRSFIGYKINPQKLREIICRAKKEILEQKNISQNN